MEPRLHTPLLLLATFLLAWSPRGASSRDIGGAQIEFIEQPRNAYYVAKKKIATITCKARYAADITFTCGGTQIPPSSVEVDKDGAPDDDVFTASINVERADVNNYKSRDGQPYWCQCSAHDIEDNVVATSNKGIIKVARIKGRAKVTPREASVKVGETIELKCEGPDAEPEAVLIWRKDKKKIHLKSNERFSVDSESTLTIKDAQVEDSGSYMCVAKNMAGRKYSHNSKVTVTASLGEVSGSEDRRRDKIPEFLVSPDESYSLDRNGDELLLNCTIRNVKRVAKNYFSCSGGLKLPEEIIEVTTDNEGIKIVTSSLLLTYQKIYDLRDKSTFCHCRAYGIVDQNWKMFTTDETKGKVFVKFFGDNFRQQPRNAAVVVGYEIRLPCRPPSGNPQPWVHWFVNENAIDPRSDDRFTIEEDGSLVIKKAEFEDAGKYYCKAQNQHGSKKSRKAELIVREYKLPKIDMRINEPIPAKPTWVNDLKSVYKLEDGVAFLTCSVIPSTSMSVTCNGKRINAGTSNDYLLQREYSKKYRTSFMSSVFAIDIEDLEIFRRESGEDKNFTCQCQVWYKPSEKEPHSTYKSSVAVVAYLEDEFVTNPEESVVAELEFEAVISCKPPRGFPKPEVYWEKDGVRIRTEDDPEIALYPEDNLYIEYVRKSTPGEYKCVAQNLAGISYSSPAEVYLMDDNVDSIGSTSPMPINDNPMFIELPKDEIYFKSNDEQIELKCIAINSASVEMKCNNKNMDAYSNDKGDFYSGQTVHYFYANISASQVKEDETLNCQCTMLPKNPEREPFIHNFIVGHIYFGNMFVKDPVDTYTDIGSEAVMTCIPPVGRPTASIQWISGSDMISSRDPRYTISEDETILTIKSVTEEDLGPYKCSAISKQVKRLSKVAYLRLYADKPETPILQLQTDADKPETPMAPAYITKDLDTNYYVTGSKPATLMCVMHRAESLVFECNDQEMGDDKVMVEGTVTASVDGKGQVEVLTGMLTITKKDVDNHKDFKCVCKGNYQLAGVMKSVKSTMASVEVAFLDEEFEAHPESGSFNSGVPLLLNCIPPKGNPSPMISWRKVGTDGVEVDLPKLQSYESSYFLTHEASASDNGIYICVAKNDAFERKSDEAHVEVVDSGVGGNGVNTGNSGMDTTTDGVMDTTSELMGTTFDGMSTSDGSTTDFGGYTFGPDVEIEVDELTTVPLTTDESSTNEFSSTLENGEATSPETGVSESSSEETSIDIQEENTTPKVSVDQTTEPDVEPEPSEESTNPIIETDSTEKVMTRQPGTGREQYPTYDPGMSSTVNKAFTLLNRCISNIETCSSYYSCREPALYECLENNVEEQCKHLKNDMLDHLLQAKKDQCDEAHALGESCPALNDCSKMDYEMIETNKYLNIFALCSNHSHLECVQNELHCALANIDDAVTADVMQSFSDELCSQANTDVFRECTPVEDCEVKLMYATRNAMDSSSYWCQLMDDIKACVSVSIKEACPEDKANQITLALYRLDRFKENCTGGENDFTSDEMISSTAQSIIGTGGSDGDDGGDVGGDGDDNGSDDGNANGGDGNDGGDGGDGDDDDDDKDDGVEETVEGTVESSKDPDDSAVSIGVSVLLMTLTQICVSFFVSH